MSKSRPEPVEFYTKTKEFVIKQGYQRDIDFYAKTKFESFTAIDFLSQYTWVVLGTGMKNQAAQSMYDKLWDKGIDTVNHKGKKKAILKVFEKYEEHFEIIGRIETLDEKLDYLENLPFIGKITKYHLAKNIGIDCAKPDRHLQRIMAFFGYEDVQKFCYDISKKTGDPINVVDVVIFRYGNLQGTNTDADTFFRRWEQAIL